jgi:mono/diheme cytochrome c family protein
VIVAAQTNQKAIGIAIFIIAILGWAVYVLLENRRSTPQIVDSFLSAPNRKEAPDDEVFEGPRLDRWLGWALIGISLTAISLPLYWLNEQNRQTGAIRGFDKRSVNRGEELWGLENGGFNCAQCHGAKGGGGVAEKYVAQYNEDGTPQLDAKGKQVQKKVSWAAPRVNNVALRYKPGQIKNVLIYGRGAAKNNPMPAWGLAGGGPGNEQQITDLVNLLNFWSIEESPEALKAYNDEWSSSRNQKKAFEKAIVAAREEGLKQSEELYTGTVNGAKQTLKTADDDRKAKAADLEAAKASGDAIKIAEAQKSADELEATIKRAEETSKLSEGALLFNLNCARCHTNGYSYGEPKEVAGGYYGPALKAKGLKQQFPEASSQVEFVTNGAADQAAYGTGGVNHWSGGGMPYFANILTEEQIKKIVEHERGLK